MALHNVSESDSFDTNVQMPADGDAADASDFETSTIRPLVNRSRWLKNLLDAVKAWSLGGTITPLGDVTLAGGQNLHLVPEGTPDVDWDNEGVRVYSYARFYDAMVMSGRPGRVPWKPVQLGSRGTNYTVNATLHNLVLLAATADIDVAIGTSGSGVLAHKPGDFVRVVNRSITNTVTFKKPDGDTYATLSATGLTWAELVYDGSDWFAVDAKL